MRRVALLTILFGLSLVLSPAPAGALPPDKPAPPAQPGGIPVATLKAIKAATVFVKMEFLAPGLRRTLPASGSGFVLLVEGKTAYVVTNHHVVGVTSEFRRLRPAGPPTLVFHSGTAREQTIRAIVVASDPSRDLAILRVSGVKDLPRPIVLDPKLELVETMPVFLFGFPFGKALSVEGGNPAITVGRGSVSSIREDRYGRVRRVQIDGDLNPGNSGGPVVDSRGRLVGIAVAKFTGTRIGMAIPVRDLSEMLLGRVAGIGFTLVRVDKDKAQVRVEAPLIDPLHKMKEVALYYRPGERGKDALRPDRTGHWPMLPEATRVALTIKDGKAVGSFTVPAKEAGKLPLTFQTSYVNAEGKAIHTQPGLYVVDFGRPATAASLPPGKAPEPRASSGSLEGLSRAVGDLKVREVSADVQKAPACLCWSADAKAFYLLDGRGVLRRIAWPALKEERRLETGHSCSWLSLSAEGLLLTVADLQQVWLLDPNTLQLKKRFRVASVRRTVSAPPLSVGLAISADNNTLTVLDLKAGTSREIDRSSLGRDAGFTHAVVTPDGRYLFTQGGIEQLQRYRLDGKTVRFEESSPRIAQNGQRIDVSPDGALVCLPSGGGNYAEREIGPYATFIYAVGHLKRPALILRLGAYPRAVGFDPRGGYIYAQNFDNQFILCSKDGARLAAHSLSDRGDEVRQFLVHPEGRRVLVLTGNRLFAVEAPAQ
jgi:hypothetical protein